MADLNLILSVLLYVFGIILLIVLTVLGIRLIKVVDDVERILGNVEEKVNSFNGFFMVINKLSDGLSNITENLIFSITNSISRIFGKNDKKEEDINNE